jgi:hypothetical protein
VKSVGKTGTNALIGIRLGFSRFEGIDRSTVYYSGYPRFQLRESQSGFDWTGCIPVAVKAYILCKNADPLIKGL